MSAIGAGNSLGACVHRFTEITGERMLKRSTQPLLKLFNASTRKNAANGTIRGAHSGNKAPKRSKTLQLLTYTEQCR